MSNDVLTFTVLQTHEIQFYCVWLFTFELKTNIKDSTLKENK